MVANVGHGGRQSTFKGGSKFDERARTCRLLGYDNGGHVYRDRDVATGEIFTSTQVEVDECSMGGRAGDDDTPSHQSVGHSVE